MIVIGLTGQDSASGIITRVESDIILEDCVVGLNGDGKFDHIFQSDSDYGLCGRWIDGADDRVDVLEYEDDSMCSDCGLRLWAVAMSAAVSGVAE